MRHGDGVEAILFDVGQVIIGLNVVRAARLLADGAGTTPEEVIAAIETDPRMAAFQEGRLTPEEWHQHLQEQLGMRLSFAEFCRAWNSALEPEPLLGAEFFSALAPQLRLGLLSNTDPIHVKQFESHFDMPCFFPVRLYSCTTGLRKPAGALYEQAIAALGSQPQKILYVDDVEEFVVAGRRAGMAVHHFRGKRWLLDELRQRRILR